jgi:hypothetical protein
MLRLFLVYIYFTSAVYYTSCPKLSQVASSCTVRWLPSYLEICVHKMGGIDVIGLAIAVF